MRHALNRGPSESRQIKFRHQSQPFYASIHKDNDIDASDKGDENDNVLSQEEFEAVLRRRRKIITAKDLAQQR